MKCGTWKALLGSSVIFLLACGAFDYRAQQYSLGRLVFQGLEVVIEFAYGGADGPEWAGFGVLLFIASLSVAAGGAMRWWREEMDGASDMGAAVLDIKGAAAGNEGTAGGAQDAAPEGVAALPESSPPPEHAHPFEHFDERGRSPLERVLAES